MTQQLIDVLKKLEDEELYFSPENLAFGDYSDTGITYIDSVDLDQTRWMMVKLTVVSFGGKLYGIEWGEGLTEMQDNEIYFDESTVFEVDRSEKVVYTYRKK